MCWKILTFLWLLHSPGKLSPAWLLLQSWYLWVGLRDRHSLCVHLSPRGGMTAVVLPFSCSAALGQSNGNSANLNQKLLHKGFFFLIMPALGFKQFVVKLFLEYIWEAKQGSYQLVHPNFLSLLSWLTLTLLFSSRLSVRSISLSLTLLSLYIATFEINFALLWMKLVLVK